MLEIQKLRNTQPAIITIGSYPAIIQSILDFDFLSGREYPSIRAIIASGRKYERYFYGKKEILIPVFHTMADVPTSLQKTLNYFLNVSSGRRAYQSTAELLRHLPGLLGGVIFAENVPEKHAIDLYQQARSTRDSLPPFIIGPASIGLIIPGQLKLGAIGGVHYRQLVDAGLFTPGSVAVLSASGGMTNEIINTVTGYGGHISFALSFGGDRFPIVTPQEAFHGAENDPQTQAIVYYGELGGTDEYDLAALIREKKVTKKVICYIAGAISEMFETPPQFGHAKALAATQAETAAGKRQILQAAGATAPESYAGFLGAIKEISTTKGLGAQTGGADAINDKIHIMEKRKSALITTSISGDVQGQPTILHQDLLSFAKSHSFASTTMSLLLGKQITSTLTEECADFILRLLVDHGPNVSGAMNTIVTARAGRDMVSSLATGLLTIGPRFGGAINQAAANWLTGVQKNISAEAFVESYASQKKYISGIGHKKYRIDLPDPRVAELIKFADSLKVKKYISFALAVEKVTTAKKGNLILNVDGVIAAILLDILSEKEGYSEKELLHLTEIEFFNALFVLSRSVGFISHYLDQKRLDEGIFRLPDDLVAYTENEE